MRGKSTDSSSLARGVMRAVRLAWRAGMRKVPATAAGKLCGYASQGVPLAQKEAGFSLKKGRFLL